MVERLVERKVCEGTVLCAARVARVFDRERLRKLAEQGTIKPHETRKDVYYIPLRDKLVNTRGERSEQTPEYRPPVTVFKGAGGDGRQSFSARLGDEIASRRFWGGLSKADALHQANIALALHAEYEKALRENDPVVLKALTEYGVSEAPTYKPIALFKPLEIPWIFGATPEDNFTRVIPPEQAAENDLALRKMFKTHVVLAYELSETNQRIATPPNVLAGVKARQDVEASRRASADKPITGARIALARHLARRKKITFSELLPEKKGKPRESVSSLQPTNVTIDGHVKDLDTSGKRKDFEGHYAYDGRWVKATLEGMPKAAEAYLKIMSQSDLHFERNKSLQVFERTAKKK